MRTWGRWLGCRGYPLVSKPAVPFVNDLSGDGECVTLDAVGENGPRMSCWSFRLSGVGGERPDLHLLARDPGVRESATAIQGLMLRSVAHVSAFQHHGWCRAVAPGSTAALARRAEEILG